MVTLDDVAARAGVSRMTASNALRGKTVVKAETARRVLAAAEELGYRPNIAARQLSSGRTHVIGLTMTDFDLIFPADLAARVSDLAQERGYQTIVQQTRFSRDFERRVLSSPATQVCDGTIVCWPSSDAADILSFGRTQPLVFFDGFGLEGQADCVFTPCVEGTRAAVRHLIQQGCRDVLVIGEEYAAPEELATANSSGRRRLLGAMRGLREAGLDYRAGNVYACPWNRQGGYDLMTRILAERRDFDGVCCLNDPLAIGALKALTDAGVSVPHEVAIVGFDGVEDGRYTTPGLTSVCVDAGEVAAACLDLLTARLDGGNAGAEDGDAAGKAGGTAAGRAGEIGGTEAAGADGAARATNTTNTTNTISAASTISAANTAGTADAARIADTTGPTDAYAPQTRTVGFTLARRGSAERNPSL
ncbi:purine operon repressor [Bifidobacterium lemurum]|uniref:Purine operon repressor n=1 Tax=Bifidobacterium lemurum TaxID=1603886 RepID=A0A261FT19_9BIFI|nr:LacI family DNA-binding transcriptional regulator [Bifidobacterium lemurum]OZG61926.1 purine operon repressor [Bifidobacterium lemurum]QOL35292.1 LacI family DNA-binding transcriptional regulator [Bifidobacterium lemurum]